MTINLAINLVFALPQAQEYTLLTVTGILDEHCPFPSRLI